MLEHWFGPPMYMALLHCLDHIAKCWSLSCGVTKLQTSSGVIDTEGTQHWVISKVNTSSCFKTFSELSNWDDSFYSVL
jgi:hypothetical protein